MSKSKATGTNHLAIWQEHYLFSRFVDLCPFDQLPFHANCSAAVTSPTHDGNISWKLRHWKAAAECWIESLMGEVSFENIRETHILLRLEVN